MLQVSLLERERLKFTGNLPDVFTFYYNEIMEAK